MIENDNNWNVNIKKCLPNWIYKVRGVHRNLFRGGGESNHRQDIKDLLNEFEALRPVLWLPLNSIHLFSLYSHALSGKSTLFRHRFWEYSPSTRAPLHTKIKFEWYLKRHLKSVSRSIAVHFVLIPWGCEFALQGNHDWCHLIYPQTLHPCKDSLPPTQKRKARTTEMRF